MRRNKEWLVFGLGIILIVMCIWKFGGSLWLITGQKVLEKSVSNTVRLFLPEYYVEENSEVKAWRSIGACVWPGYYSTEETNGTVYGDKYVQAGKDITSEAYIVEDETTNYESLAREENLNYESMLRENHLAKETAVSVQDEPQVNGSLSGGDGGPFGGDKVCVINREKLNDFDYLCQNFYIIDSSTTADSSVLNAKTLLGKDMTVSREGEEPQILIYHTHSQEGYADSVPGDPGSSVVAVGDYLAELLTNQYGFSVLHHTGEYDVDDRDHAYSNAAPALQQILADNPGIQVVIDLHRDSVREETHLVTEIGGKQTAKIMFFNGLCKPPEGSMWNLQNPYLEDNLALSLQLQIAAAEKYPDFTRRIYLKGYRYNMNYCPKSLLVEVGAQNNSLQEAKNAMEPLADILAEVLQ